MGSSRKKIVGKYQKKTPTYHRINVANYLAMASNSNKKHSLRYYLLKYLSTHRDCCFATLDDIAEAIFKEYKGPDFEKAPSRSAISKKLDDIYGDLVFDDGTYYFDKVETAYMLRPRFSYKDPLLTELFELKNAFKYEQVHSLNKFTKVFSVYPDAASRVKNLFMTVLGPTCFGIMYCDEHLIIMLNKDDERFDAANEIISSFFIKRRAYQKALKDQAEARRKIKAQNKEIQKNREKYKNYNLSGPVSLSVKI